mmetsp:Transcript_21498/g.36929  ORF Transcript_21498/g.36929 Transcript_21498/m.36929 type:complete len:271 (-) Transcript_21498:192-1004(-)
MLLLRRPHTLLSRSTLPMHQHQDRSAFPFWSIIRYNSNKIKQWPAVHPRKKHLKKVQRVLYAKNNPNAEPLPPPKVEKGPVTEPTRRELYVVALHQAIPFVGFGIMDNAILLLAGEAIDIYLGVTLGISTMCAAAIGNIISDLGGVAFGTVIEDALLRWSKKVDKLTKGKIKLPPAPKLSYDQRNLRSVRWSSQLGCAAGLTVGCVIGMFPLLFFPEDERSKERENEDGVAAKKLINEQNEQLKKEIGELKERLRTFEREKNDGLWDKGY